MGKEKKIIENMKYKSCDAIIKDLKVKNAEQKEGI